MHDAVPARRTPGVAMLGAWQAYALATAATGATLAIRIAFDDLFQGYPGLIIFAAPILLSAALGGLRGGLMATALSCMASQYMLYLPLREMVVDKSFHRWLQASLALGGLIISAMNEALHRARRRSHEAAREQEDAYARLEWEKAKLTAAEATYRAIFENSTDGIFQNTPEGTLLTANPALARMLGFGSPEELIRERTDLGRQSYAEPGQREDFRRRLEERGFIDGFEYEVLRKDGTKIWVSENARIVRDGAGRAVRYDGSMQDITARRRSEAELRKAHNELIEVSRLGGMAEVATDVMHNVGNVLNSINVAAALAVDNVKGSRASRLAEVVKLLREHQAELGAYLTSDPAGRHIPDLLESLSREWVGQQQLLARELEELRGNVDLVKRIVASQQARAMASEIIESATLEDLVEEAVKVQQGVLTEQQVEIVRDYQPLGPIRVSRHKAIQILVALLRNARQASKGLDTKRRITLGIASLGARAAVTVTDNGMGIAKENLVSIFAPGFTTRRDSRGHGLHSSALAAIELGGKLSAHSDGIGQGATFTLELPLRHAVAA